MFQRSCLDDCIGLPCCNLLALEMYRSMHLWQLWDKVSSRCARQLQPSLASGMCDTGWRVWTLSCSCLGVLERRPCPTSYLAGALDLTSLPGNLGPTSSSGNLGSNFLSRELRVQLPSPRDFPIFPGLSGNLSLHISRDVPGEATCRAFPGETFSMTMLVIPRRLFR